MQHAYLFKVQLLRPLSRKAMQVRNAAAALFDAAHGNSGFKKHLERIAGSLVAVVKTGHLRHHH